ncbi:MAG TPA: hypothetical protein GXZ43_06210 [Clostridiaceae bacterium]|nr:hypothetical protein [Clostridiaceae bacterium]
MRKILIFLVLVLMILSFCACSKPEKSIVGTWKNKKTVFSVVTETTYTFNEDGTGTKSGILDIDFTYSFSEEKLLITTSILGVKTTEEYSYDFDGDKLVLTGEKGSIDLEKVK